MEFSGDFDKFEWTIVGIFIALYILYIVRMIIVAYSLKTSFHKVIFKFILRSAYLGLILIAFLGPYIKDRKQKEEGKAIARDIYLAFDRSLSMKAKDVPPNRMLRAKNELSKVIEHFKADNFGIIVFPASRDSVFCPLTFDKNVIIDQHLDIIEPVRGGTDFFPPLNTALIKHKNNNKTKTDAKLIILVSDGEDYGEETYKIVEQLRANDITLFTVGVGTREGGRIPFGRNFFKDNQGHDVVSKLNPKSLKEIAKETNGKYFELSRLKNEIPELISAIEEIEGEVQDTKELEVPLDFKYKYFLFAALALILLDILLSIRIFKI